MAVFRTFKGIRDFKGVWIPKDIWFNENLTPLEKVILVEIDSLDNDEDNGCIASNRYLADFCQCSESKISKTITKLQRLGYIEIIDYDNGFYRKIKSLVKNTMGGSKKYEGPSQKVLPINIDNNIDIKNSSSIYDFIEVNFSRTLNPIELEIIKTWEDTELTRYAIKQAVLNLKYNIKYIDKILYQYKLKNITSVAQAQEDEVNYKIQTEKKYKKKETFEEMLDRKLRESGEE